MAKTNKEALRQIIVSGDLDRLRWFALACAEALDRIAALSGKSNVGDPVLVPGPIIHLRKVGKKHESSKQETTRQSRCAD